MLKHLQEEFGYDVWIDTSTVSLIGRIKREKVFDEKDDYQDFFGIVVDGCFITIDDRLDLNNDDLDEEALEKASADTATSEKIIRVRKFLIDEMKRHRGGA